MSSLITLDLCEMGRGAVHFPLCHAVGMLSGMLWGPGTVAMENAQPSIRGFYSWRNSFGAIVRLFDLLNSLSSSASNRKTKAPNEKTFQRENGNTGRKLLRNVSYRELILPVWLLKRLSLVHHTILPFLKEFRESQADGNMIFLFVSCRHTSSLTGRMKNWKRELVSKASNRSIQHCSVRLLAKWIVYASYEVI